MCGMALISGPCPQNALACAGGTKGIGAACVHELASLGAEVILWHLTISSESADHTLTLLGARLLLVHALQVFFCSRSAPDVQAAAEAWQQQGLKVQVGIWLSCPCFLQPP